MRTQTIDLRGEKYAEVKKLSLLEFQRVSLRKYLEACMDFLISKVFKFQQLLLGSLRAHTNPTIYRARANREIL